MKIAESIEICMTKYADFNGRASRSEFWWFFLFEIMISVAADIITHNDDLSSLLGLAFLLPNLAVGARRLHDIGKSGWWQLLMITGIGLIPLFIFWARDSDSSENIYGPRIVQTDL